MNERHVINVKVERKQRRTGVRACLHGGWGPQVGEVARLSGVTRVFLYLSFLFDQVYMIGGVTLLGGLAGLPVRVTLSAGVALCHVNVSRWGNQPRRSPFHFTFETTLRSFTPRPRGHKCDFKCGLFLDHG